MNAYIEPIKYAFVFFPFIAALFTLPFMFLEYRKFGAIPLFKSLIVFSFILYLVNIYFLVILPLPPIAEVHLYTTPISQLTPFNFISDLVKEANISLSDPTTFINVFKTTVFYQVFFNILLFVPLGIYLKYYFKFSFKKMLMAVFLISLFCELTQLSGLYFIYSRPYRLFDVDDLIINTLGGMLGYLIAPLFIKFIPSKNRIEQHAYKMGQFVPFFRSLMAFMIDWLIIFLVTFVIKVLLKIQNIEFILDSTYLYIIQLTVYFIFFQYFNHGQSIGKKCMKFKIVNKNGKNPRFYEYLLRYFILYGFILACPSLIISCLVLLIDAPFAVDICIIIIILCLMIVFVSFIFSLIKYLFGNKKPLIYAKISNTTYVSLIKFEIDQDKNKPATLVEKETTSNILNHHNAVEIEVNEEAIDVDKEEITIKETVFSENDALNNEDKPK